MQIVPLKLALPLYLNVVYLSIVDSEYTCSYKNFSKIMTIFLYIKNFLFVLRIFLYT